MIPRITRLALLCASTALLYGCFDSGSEATPSGYSNTVPPTSVDATQPRRPGIGNQTRSAVRIAFDPQNQVIPFPNNLLFEAGASHPNDLDGTLNVPIDDPEASSASVAKALNELDGFSTVASWRVAFTAAIDPSSLHVGDTVRVFEMVTRSERYPERIRPAEIARELTTADLSLDYHVDSHVLYIQPRQPLAYDTTYSVVITHGITDLQGLWVDGPLTSVVAKGQTELQLDENGQPTVCDDLNKSQVALLQCMTHFAIDPLLRHEQLDLQRDGIMLAWSLTTQRADTAFTALASDIRDRRINPTIPGGNTCKRAVCLLDVGSLPGKDAPESPNKMALVWPGTIRLPVLGYAPTQAMNVSANSYGFGRSGLADQGVLNAQWQCAEGRCNSDDSKLGAVDADVTLVQRPEIKGWVTHPVVLAAPNHTRSGVPAKPAGGYPLVIFQHAIQQDRTNALAMADALAQQGFAVIAIDMPLHGLVKHVLPANDPRAALYAGDLNDQLYNSTLNAARNLIPFKVERTFYLDLVDGLGQANSDGVIDGSGSHFLNPSAPLTQRDTLRQAALDLVTMVRYLKQGEFEQCGMRTLSKQCGYSRNIFGTPNFDIDLKNHINFNQIHFVGHSVGNIVAAPFLAFQQDIVSVTQLAPTGGIMRSLEGSDTIGSRLVDGLAANGVVQGSENYYRFFASVQAAIDAVEPLNHAVAVTTRTNTHGETEARPVLMAQLLGDENNASDKVLPIELTTAPLAGSTPLARAMGLIRSAELAEQGDNALAEQLTLRGAIQDDESLAPLQVSVGFRRGEHASFLLPQASIEGEAIVGDDPHAEMQRQVANFLRNQGTQIEHIDRNWLR